MPYAVATVSVNPAAPIVVVGSTLQLTATAKDSAGNPLSGRSVSWTTSNPGVAGVSPAGLATGVSAGSATITATIEGKSATVTIVVTAAPPTVTTPGTVSDLKVAAATDTSVTLGFTEVTDGSGSPASYDIRLVTGTSLTWGSAAPSVNRGTCATPVAGTTIGAKRTCTVLGLAPTTAYNVQLVAYRGTLKVNAAFAGLSHIATGTTAGAAALPVASVSASPATACVSAGGTGQLTATPQDSLGRAPGGRAGGWGTRDAGVGGGETAGGAGGG